MCFLQDDDILRFYDKNKIDLSELELYYLDFTCTLTLLGLHIDFIYSVCSDLDDTSWVDFLKLTPSIIHRQNYFMWFSHEFHMIFTWIEQIN